MPSFAPTISPTNSPSSAPSFSPTVAPSTIPTDAPTADYGITWTSSASFSSSFQRIYFNIDNIGALKGEIFNPPTVCSQIFSSGTINLIGNDALCAWNNDRNQITVYLPSTSQMFVTDGLVIAPFTLKYIFKEVQFDLDVFLSVEDISIPSDIELPVILVNSPSTVGICDPLAIDGSQTYNLGGRLGTFTWKVSNSYPLGSNAGLVGNTILHGENKDKISFSAGEVQAGTILEVELTVSTWYNGASSRKVNVTKSGQAVPSLSLSGLYDYSKDSSNGKTAVSITSTVSFDDSCIAQSGNDEENSVEMNRIWSLSKYSIDAGDTLNTTRIGVLIEFLSLLENEDSLTLDVDDYLQPGVTYDFKLTVNCKTPHICTAFDIHTLKFSYASLKCQITGGNTDLEGSIENIQAYIKYLNGDQYTYDPDKSSVGDKDHLVWNWKCERMLSGDPNTVENCDGVFAASMNSRKQYAYFKDETFVIRNTYEYTLSMEVEDSNLVSRKCTSNVEFTASIVEKEEGSEGKTLATMVLSLTSTSGSEISSTDRLRLLSMVILDPTLNWWSLGEYKYLWSEARGQLTIPQIWDIQTNPPNSSNLVLAENVLTPGNNYRFKVEIWNRDEETPAYGQASVDVYVNTPPNIVSGSFIVSPDCSKVTYDSFEESLTSFYTLSVSANGDFTPLSYQFAYNLKIDGQTTPSPSAQAADKTFTLLHSSSLASSYLPNVILPLADEETIISMKVSVFDAEGSFATDDSVVCEFKVREDFDDRNCFDYLEIVQTFSGELDNSQTENIRSTSEILHYIFQTSLSILHSMDRFREGCIVEYMEEILSVANSYLGSEALNLCKSEYVGVIATIVGKWMSVASLENIERYINRDEFVETLTKWNNLMDQSYDPCDILDNIQTDGLYVSSDSIITEKPAIFYKNDDITSDLSYILTDPLYSSVFISFIDSAIHGLSAINEYAEKEENSFAPEDASKLDKIVKGVFEKVLKALYIAELLDVSITIPTEFSTASYGNFEVFTTRSHNSTISIDLTDVSIEIDSTATGTEREDFDDEFESVDVVVISLHTAKVSNATWKEEGKCEVGGELAGEEISISLVSDGNTSSLNSNVSILFTDLGFDVSLINVSSLCVFWNELEKVWSKEGCTTIVHPIDQSIKCTCNHLTTFSIIEGIHDECSELAQALINDEAWFWMNLFCCVLFSIMPVHIAVRLKMMRYYKVFKIKHVATSGLILIGILSLCQFLISLEFIFLTKAWNREHVKLLSVFLILPLIFYHILFSLMIRSFVFVAYVSSMTFKTSVAPKFTEALIMANVFVGLFFVVTIGLMLGDVAYYKAAEGVWVTLLVISVISFGFYGLKATLVVKKSTAHVGSSRDTKSDNKALRKMVTLVTSFLIFFLWQAFLAVYHSLTQIPLDVTWRAAEMASHLIILVLIFKLYDAKARGYIRAKLEAEELDSRVGTPRAGSKRSTLTPRARRRTATGTDNLGIRTFQKKGKGQKVGKKLASKIRIDSASGGLSTTSTVMKDRRTTVTRTQTQTEPKLPRVTITAVPPTNREEQKTRKKGAKQLPSKIGIPSATGASDAEHLADILELEDEGIRPPPVERKVRTSLMPPGRQKLSLRRASSSMRHMVRSAFMKVMLPEGPRESVRLHDDWEVLGELKGPPSLEMHRITHFDKRDHLNLPLGMRLTAHSSSPTGGDITDSTSEDKLTLGDTLHDISDVSAVSRKEKQLLQSFQNAQVVGTPYLGVSTFVNRTPSKAESEESGLQVDKTPLQSPRTSEVLKRPIPKGIPLIKKKRNSESVAMDAALEDIWKMDGGTPHPSERTASATQSRTISSVVSPINTKSVSFSKGAKSKLKLRGAQSDMLNRNKTSRDEEENLAIDERFSANVSRNLTLRSAKSDPRGVLPRVLRRKDESTPLTAADSISPGGLVMMDLPDFESSSSNSGEEKENPFQNPFAVVKGKENAKVLKLEKRMTSKDEEESVNLGEDDPFASYGRTSTWHSQPSENPFIRKKTSRNEEAGVDLGSEASLSDDNAKYTTRPMLTHQKSSSAPIDEFETGNARASLKMGNAKAQSSSQGKRKKEKEKEKEKRDSASHESTGSMVLESFRNAERASTPKEPVRGRNQRRDGRNRRRNARERTNAKQHTLKTKVAY